MHLLGSPRVDGDDDEEDVDDLDNEFNYAQGTSKARHQWQGEDSELSSSSRHDSQRPIPLLTNGQPVSDEKHNGVFFITSTNIFEVITINSWCFTGGPGCVFSSSMLLQFPHPSPSFLVFFLCLPSPSNLSHVEGKSSLSLNIR